MPRSRISYAKLLLAWAWAEQSVVDQLQAQLDAFRTDSPAAALRGSDANDGLSVGMDLFEIISGAGNDSIRVQANNATIDAGAGNDVIDIDGHANIVAGEVTMSSAPMVIRPWMAAPAMIISTRMIIQR